jgi:hypothetical protein
MKKLFTLATLSLCLMSCEPDQPKDCGCDRVKQILTPQGHFGGPGQPVNFTTKATFITINDCSGIQLTKTGYNVKLDQCR